MNFLRIAPFVLALSLVSEARAQDIRVLTLDPSRVTTCQTLSWDIVAGNALTDVRGWLTDPNRFGAAGTVPRAVSFTPQAQLLDPATLAGADVVLMSLMSRPLLRCEVEDLLEFINQGGGVFVFSNSGTLDYNAALGSTFGGIGSGPATVVDPSSPVASGPFGNVTGSIGNFQFHRVLSDVGPLGNAVVETSGAVITEFTIGAGRLVIAGDEEWVMSTSLSPCAAGQLPNTARQTLFLNGFASVVPQAGFQYVPNPRTLGTRYCSPAVLNSRGLPATICATGSDQIADDDVTLAVDWIAPNAFGYFLVSRGQSFVAMPGGSQGNLCLAQPIGRYVGASQVQNSGAGGFFTLPISLTAIPQPTGFVAAASGETWNFQAWYRDANPNSTSNFTDGISITFQ